MCSVPDLLLTFLIKLPLIYLNLPYLCGLIGILFEVSNRLDGSSHLQCRFIVLIQCLKRIQLIFDMVSTENNYHIGFSCSMFNDIFHNIDIYNMLGLLHRFADSS